MSSQSDVISSESLKNSATPWAELMDAMKTNDQRMDHLTELVTLLAKNVDRDTCEDINGSERIVRAEAEAERLQAELTTAYAENGSLASERDTMTDKAEHWEKECETLRAENAELRSEISELCSQNEGLAASVASGQVREQLSHEQTETLSWEERKELIFQQMEDDTFDAEVFVDGIAKELVSETEQADAESDPMHFVQGLLERLDRAEAERDRQREEISQLQRSLEERSPVVAGNNGQPMAMGAAALVGLIDDNELVQQERERLKELQTQWEEKFRKIEVDSSLARAKLSRERQELANRLAEVETELEQARRAGRVEEETGGASRKWLAKLGIE